MLEFEQLQKISIDKPYLTKIVENKQYNKTIIEHYNKLAKEYPLINFDNQINNLLNCNSWWLLDYYKQQKIKDFKKTNLCKDKFCNNCKKVKQANRITKFIPLIDEMSKDNFLYHMVLTVPNCSGIDLKNRIENIFKNFYTLNRYLKLEKKIKGLDFEQYSYIGAIRSLEVTYSQNNYHPHIHCIIALEKALDDNKHIVNTYSRSKKNGYRKFTNFEILIQKIWYLLNNNQRVTEKAISSLQIGYSCTIDPIDESSVYEVFKYMTKSNDEFGNVLTYNNFKDLYFGLYRVRQIQGYGCFYNIKDDESLINQVDDYYDALINILRLKENPLEVCEAPEDLLIENENILISRKVIFKYLRNL